MRTRSVNSLCEDLKRVGLKDVAKDILRAERDIQSQSRIENGIQLCRSIVEHIKSHPSVDATLYRQLLEYQEWTRRLVTRDTTVWIILSSGVAEEIFVSTGTWCLILGLMCYVKQNQPLAVWVSAYAALGGYFAVVGSMRIFLALPMVMDARHSRTDFRFAKHLGSKGQVV